MRRGIVLHQHRERAVFRCPRFGADALGDFLLNQDCETVKAAAFHAFGQHRRGNIVGQIGAENGPQAGKVLLHHLRKVQPHSVAFDQREIVRPAHGFPQHGIEPGVQLHGYHLSGTAGKLLGQRADTGTDLQHTGIFISAAAVGDIPGHPVLNEKILTHRLGKMKAMAFQQSLYFTAVTKIHHCLLLNS